MAMCGLSSWGGALYSLSSWVILSVPCTVVIDLGGLVLPNRLERKELLTSQKLEGDWYESDPDAVLDGGGSLIFRKFTLVGGHQVIDASRLLAWVPYDASNGALVFSNGDDGEECVELSQDTVDALCKWVDNRRFDVKGGGSSGKRRKTAAS
jgi:hypothetical protein